MRNRKALLFVNDLGFFFSHRLPIALAGQARGFNVSVSAPEDSASAADVARLAKHNLKWLPVPVRRHGLNPLKDLKTLEAVGRILLRERPDILHNVTAKCILHGSLAARLVSLPGLPPLRVINAVSGLGFAFIRQSADARLARNVIRAGYRLLPPAARTWFIFQNADDQRLFEREGMVKPGRSVIVRGSGVDLEHFQPVASKPTAPKRVVLPARLLWDKGVREFADAARLLRPDFLDVEFCLAGGLDTTYRQHVPEAQVRAWESEGLLRWLGHQHDMLACLQAADIACLPSYREGLPKALLEAAACGLPIVTTDVPGCREVVEDGINGLLVPARDASALAGALRRVLTDSDLAARLGAASRQRSATHFCAQALAGQTIDLWERALDSGAAR